MLVLIYEDVSSKTQFKRWFSIRYTRKFMAEDNGRVRINALWKLSYKLMAEARVNFRILLEISHDFMAEARVKRSINSLSHISQSFHMTNTLNIREKFRMAISWEFSHYVMAEAKWNLWSGSLHDLKTESRGDLGSIDFQSFHMTS